MNDHPEDKVTKVSDLREKPRWCTDILFMLLIIAAWIAMTGIGFAATGAIKSPKIPTGNPNRLIHAMDYNGSFCGVSNGVSKLPYSYYMANGAAVCVESCPSITDYTKFICKYEYQQAADQSILVGYENVFTFSCMYQVKTISLLFRCISNTDLTIAMEEAKQTAQSYGMNNITNLYYSSPSSKGQGWFSDFLGDLLQVRGYIFGFGIGVTVGIAILYLYILRIPYLLNIIIWFIIISIFVILIIGSFLLWKLAKTWSQDGLHTHPEVMTMYVFSYIGMGCTVFYFCMMVVLRKRIELAIGIIKETCKAFASMIGILFIPVLLVIGLMLFLLPWVIYVLYLASSGSSETITGSQWVDNIEISYSYQTYKFADVTKYIFIYMVFILFWTSEFILACGQIMMALCFSSWYFTRNKKETLLGNEIVSWAIRTTICYHMGTAAFGSLIIAIIQTIRTILLYLEKQSKQENIYGKIMKYIYCILQCIFTCIEKIMKYINKNAYIITAIHGTSYCSSANTVFHLLLRNILRVSAMNLVSSFVLLLGQLFIPIVTTFLCYLGLAYAVNSAEVSGIIAPLVLTFCLSYWISTMFMEIFGMGIETILICFISDEEMHSIENRFVEPELQKVIMETEQRREELKIDPPFLFHKHLDQSIPPTSNENQATNNNATATLNDQYEMTETRDVLARKQPVHLII